MNKDRLSEILVPLSRRTFGRTLAGAGLAAAGWRLFDPARHAPQRPHSRPPSPASSPSRRCRRRRSPLSRATTSSAPMAR